MNCFFFFFSYWVLFLSIYRIYLPVQGTKPLLSISMHGNIYSLLCFASCTFCLIEILNSNVIRHIHLYFTCCAVHVSIRNLSQLRYNKGFRDFFGFVFYCFCNRVYSFVLHTRSLIFINE